MSIRTRGLCAAMTLAAATLAPAAAADFPVQRCVNMGNALDAPQEGDWGLTLEESYFAEIAAAGFDAVRLPVRWSNHTADGPDYTIDPAFLARVDEVLGWALAHDLNVVLNIHHFEELNSEPRRNRDKFLALWRQIAPHYADLPASVTFEVINEPNGEFAGALMQDHVRAAVAIIRESNPDRTLMIGGENWSHIETLSSIPELDDPNIVHTFHYYLPFEFTHQKTSWTELADSDTVRWTGTEAEMTAIGADMAEARAHADATGRVVFMGEFGAYEAAPRIDGVDWLNAVRQYAEAYGLPWCVWNFSSSYPVYDTQARAWDHDKLYALGLADEPTPELLAMVAAEAADPDADLSVGATIDEEFNRVRMQLPRDGDLVAAPFPNAFAHYGDMDVRVVAADDLPGGEALRVQIQRGGGQRWDQGVNGPLAGVAAGSRLAVSFTARAVEGSAVIGRFGLQLGGPPYTEILGGEASLDTTPRRFIATGLAPRDFAPGEAGFFLQVGGQAQTLLLGPVFVFDLGPDGAPDAQP